MGMSLAWLAVLLPARNPSVSPWVSFLVVAYPSIDMFYTVSRRIGYQQSVASPDTFHLPCLVFERLRGWNFSVRSVLICNSISGFSMVMIASVGPIIAVALHDNERLLITASLAYAAAYSVVYRWLAGPRWLEIGKWRAPTIPPVSS